jgi:hypothetical protein
MVAFWLLFLVSTVNVGMGYALAVYLGYGPPSLRDAWIALGADGAAPAVPDAALFSAANAVSSDDLGQQGSLQEIDAIGGLAAHQPDYGVETPESGAEYGGGAT